MNATRGVTVLRTLFIVGFAYQALNYFLPDVRLTGQMLNLWLKMGGGGSSVSDCDLARLCFHYASLGWGIYNISWSVAFFTFVALAIFYPRRWVFITGAVFAVYTFLMESLSLHGGEVRPLAFPLVLCNIAVALTLVGFAIMPPNTALEPTPTTP
jgi:hypothetical protein